MIILQFWAQDLNLEAVIAHKGPDMVVLGCRGPKGNYFGVKKASYVCLRSSQS